MSEAALATGGCVAMQRAGAGNFVEQAACLAELRLRCLNIMVMHRLEKTLGLLPDAVLAPAVT